VYRVLEAIVFSLCHVNQYVLLLLLLLLLLSAEPRSDEPRWGRLPVESHLQQITAPLQEQPFRKKQQLLPKCQ